jgi:hypothetical protein
MYVPPDDFWHTMFCEFRRLESLGVLNSRRFVNLDIFLNLDVCELSCFVNLKVL